MRSRTHAAGQLVVCGALFALAVVLVACDGHGAGSSKPSSKPSTVVGKRGKTPPLSATSAVLSPDGSRIAAVGRKGVTIWSTADGAVEKRFGGGTVLAWSPDGRTLAVDGQSKGRDRTPIELLNASSGSSVRTLSGHRFSGVLEAPSAVVALVYSPDGSTLASTGYDGVVRLWSVKDGRQQAELDPTIGSPSAIAFSPDGRRLAIAGSGAPVEIWDTSTSKRVGTLASPSAGRVLYTRDGRFLVTTRDVPGSAPGKGMRVWDARTLRPIRAFPGQVDALSLAADDQGDRLAFTTIGSSDVRVWPVAGGKTTIVHTHQKDADVVGFAPDGRTLYTASREQGLAGWDVASGKPGTRFRHP